MWAYRTHTRAQTHTLAHGLTNIQNGYFICELRIFVSPESVLPIQVGQLGLASSVAQGLAEELGVEDVGEQEEYAIVQMMRTTELTDAAGEMRRVGWERNGNEVT
ncbi:unnamed protein product [Protopolystoma xenopodis]|uniref:Uncharacterized protein n=1 Tax=Protopolystoma xenopodis TaxID=117903 RepID=A0A3S5CGU1_9PLAT|nr:unnamed protein product [Protopolystoma xenopodis]